MIDLKDIKKGAIFYNHTHEVICPMEVIKIEKDFIVYLAYMQGSGSKIDCLYISPRVLEAYGKLDIWHKDYNSALKAKGELLIITGGRLLRDVKEDSLRKKKKVKTK
jgi:hypothetical protein